jgi:hypothetical protein
MLLSTPVEALVRLIKSAANAKAARTALKTDGVGGDETKPVVTKSNVKAGNFANARRIIHVVL